MAVSQVFTMLFAGLGIVGALVPWEQACSSGWCTYGDCESGLCSYGSCSGGHCCYSKCVGSGCEFDSCSGGGCSYNSNCSGIRSPVAIAGISGLCVLACCCMVCCYFMAFCWCTLPNKSMPVITVAPTVGRMQQTVLE